MQNKGRPRIRNVQLKNGFYIEVCNMGFKKGIKIWSGSRKAMEDSASQYASYKEVIILGEYKDGVPYVEIAVS
jgi:hypothetical protein